MPTELKSSDKGRINLAGQEIEYRLRPRRRGRSLLVRVGLQEVEVLHPPSRPREDVDTFLRENSSWLIAQLDRLARLASLRPLIPTPAGHMLFLGSPTAVEVESVPRRAQSNQVRWNSQGLLIVGGRKATATPATTLENWLRRQARKQIAPRVAVFAERLGVTPGRLYVMDQRTKWGNCSSLGNLSFSWRIVMAPESVLDYLVAHEVTHLAVPDHSRKFWLTLQSLCPESERARQWLSAYGHQLLARPADMLAALPNRGATEALATSATRSRSPVKAR